MFDAVPTTAAGWIGWFAAALVTAFVYLPKAWSERNGENREIDRLVAALTEERSLRREVEKQRDEAREQNAALIREFADIKATNARMELQITYLTEEITELKQELHSSRTKS